MRILSLSVKSFGKLRNVKLDFNNGVNVIQNTNGFGKTTMANFIRAMLYGFTKTKTANDPLRYMPWNSTELYGGSMTIEHDGENYLVERFFGKTAAKEQLTVTNLKTAKPLRFEGSLGEYLLDLTVDSYDRSAYFPQEAVELATNDKLEARLANLVENGAEDYVKIQKRLYDYKKNLKINRGVGGKIPELQARRSELARALVNAQQAEKREKEIERRLKQIDERNRQIEKEQKQNNQQTASLQKQLAQCQPSAEELASRERLRELNEKIARLPTEFNEDKQRCDEIDKEIAGLKNDVKPRVYPSKPLLICSAVLAVLGVILCFVPIPQNIGLIVGASLIALGVAGAVVAFTRKGAKTLVAGEYDALVSQYYAIAQKYVCVTNLDFNDVRKEMWKAHSNYMGDLRAREELQRTVTSAQTGGEEYERQLDEITARCEELNREVISLSKEQGRISEERKTLNVDTASIQDEILSVENELERLTYSYNVASRVETLLAEAKDNLSTSYLPRLTARCQELINVVTKGSYEVMIDRTFAVSLRENGLTKPVGDFSRGVREIMFLCFRLALAELLYDGAIPFVIVDDAFVNYDEDNFVRATDLLKHVARAGQVLYFTCHERLGNLLK